MALPPGGTPYTIDLTPTWASVLPILLTAYTDGTPEGQRLAEQELKRMAKIADAAGALQEAENDRTSLARAMRDDQQ